MQTGPGLGEEHRAAQFHPHQDVEDKVNGRKDEEGTAAEYDIDYSLKKFSIHFLKVKEQDTYVQ